MENHPQIQTPPPVNASLRYPDMNAWEKAVKACQTVDELNERIKELRIGERNPGGTIHRFKQSGQMALAVWHTNHKGEEFAQRFGAYKLSDGTWRMPLSALTSAPNDQPNR